MFAELETSGWGGLGASEKSRGIETLTAKELGDTGLGGTMTAGGLLTLPNF